MEIIDGIAKYWSTSKSMVRRDSNGWPSGIRTGQSFAMSCTQRNRRKALSIREASLTSLYTGGLSPHNLIFLFMQLRRVAEGSSTSAYRRLFAQSVGRSH